MTFAQYRHLSYFVVSVCTLLLSGVSQADPAPNLRSAKINFVVSGTIVAVSDGDTLTMQATTRDRFHIRLSDLDAPEIAHASNPYAEHGGHVEHSHRHSCPNAPAQAPGQAAGDAAAASLRALAPLHAAARAECYEADNYGRLVCHVFVGSTNVNLEQLRRGWGMTPSKARWIRDPASVPAEEVARAARLGLWAHGTPLAPAHWRDRCWCDGQCADAQH